MAERSPFSLNSPGIGEVGEIVFTNENTRAVFVSDTISTSVDSLHRVADDFLRHNQPVSRNVMKAASTVRHEVGSPLGRGNLHVEGVLPFTSYQGDEFYWIVGGENCGDRLPDTELMVLQANIINNVANNPSYEPQNSKDLLEFARQHNPQYPNFRLTQITSQNIEDIYPSLQEVYRQAFDAYPYDVAGAIRETCDINVFVAALSSSGEVISITGAEFMIVASQLLIAEIGDSASLNSAKGFGPLMKRYLFQVLADTKKIPMLTFTDSRIALDGAVLKANRRAGLMVDNILLPWHTIISSADRDPGIVREIDTPNGRRHVENMTMTWADHDRITYILDTYGRIDA